MLKMGSLYSAEERVASIEANHHLPFTSIMRLCGQRESRFSPGDGRARNSNPEEISSRTAGALKSEPLLVPSGIATGCEIQLEGRTTLHHMQFLCTSKSRFRHPGYDPLAEPGASEHLGQCRKRHGHIADRLCPSTGFPAAPRSIDSPPRAGSWNVAAAGSFRIGI